MTSYIFSSSSKSLVSKLSFFINFTYIKCNQSVPDISRFFGIILKKHFGDYYPPHFQVEYQEFILVYDIQILNVI